MTIFLLFGLSFVSPLTSVIRFGEILTLLNLLWHIFILLGQYPLLLMAKSTKGSIHLVTPTVYFFLSLSLSCLLSKPFSFFSIYLGKYHPISAKISNRTLIFYQYPPTYFLSFYLSFLLSFFFSFF